MNNVNDIEHVVCNDAAVDRIKNMPKPLERQEYVCKDGDYLYAVYKFARNVSVDDDKSSGGQSLTLS